MQGLASHGSKILIPGLIADQKDQTPNKIRDKTANQHDHKDWQSLPQNWGAVLKCEHFDGVARS
jgi:hypothetical protein